MDESPVCAAWQMQGVCGWVPSERDVRGSRREASWEDCLFSGAAHSLPSPPAVACSPIPALVFLSFSSLTPACTGCNG
jgi:hypothetical protein